MGSKQPAINPATVRSRRLRHEREKDGIKELRGVFVPLALHKEAKQFVRDWLRGRLADGQGQQ